MNDFHPGYVLNGVFYALAGIALFLLAVTALTKIIPYPLWREVVENKNVALAILAGAMALAIAWIIAAAVH